MQTYAESKAENPFDWNEFLNKKHISKREWKEAEVLSSNWVTCACGNQCDIIPREFGGNPKDLQLACFGLDFNFQIKQRDIEEAKDTLRLIEERSAQVIAEIKSKQ